MTEYRVPDAPGTANGRNRKRKAQIHAEPVEVFCRIKPVPGKEPHDLCCVVSDESTVRIYNPDDLNKPTAKETHFAFTKVFDQDTTQPDVFNHTALRLVDDLINGKNGLLFAYGVTSSGKTHTVTGTPDHPGILPRSIDAIFNSISNCQTPKYIFKPDHVNTFDIQSEAAAMEEARLKDGTIAPRTLKRERNEWISSTRVRDPSAVIPVEENLYAVFVSYIEVYNDFIFDLLDDQSFDNASYGRGPLTKQLKRSFDGSYFVSGLEEIEIKSATEAFELLWKGQQRRRSAHTSLNDSSSRSHSVFNIRVVQAPRYAVEAAIAERRSSDASTCPTFTKHSLWISQLSIVDLAGSERNHRTQTKGDRLREGCGINQSLMTLRMCMEKLRSNQTNNQSEMVPYNNSKLTTMFKNFFEGIGSVRMVICINPSGSEYRENIHVMKFAEMSQEVQVFHTDVTAKMAAQFIPPPPPPPPPVCLNPQPIPPPLPRSKVDGRGDGIAFTPSADENKELRRPSKNKKRSRSRSPGFREIPLQPQSLYPIVPFPLSMDIPPPNDSHEPDQMTFQLIRDSILNRRAKLEELRCETNQRFDSCRSSAEATYHRYYEISRECNDLRAGCDQRDAEVKAARDFATSLQVQVSQLQRDIRRIKVESSNQDRLRQQQMAHMADSVSTTSTSSGSSSPALPPFRTGMGPPKTATKPARTVFAQAQVHSNPALASGKKPAPSNRLQSRDQPLMSPGTFARTTSNPDVSVNQAHDQTIRTRVGPGAPPKSAMKRPMATPLQNADSIQNLVSASASSAVAANAPVVGHLRQRRSKSAERWLEHETTGVMKLDTVLQPNLSGKKRKSVTELTLADTKAADKYLLRTQTKDEPSGDLKEMLFKGDVVPTVSGGASVILTEVEELRITSPNVAGTTSALKSDTVTSTPVPARLSSSNQQLLSPARVEERCAVGIAGRDGFKKTVINAVHQSPSHV